MRAKGTWAFPLSLAALHHRFIHPFGGCRLRRITRRFIDIHHADLRLALGSVMATVSIGLFVSASYPAVTSNACETGDRPAHWPGFLTKESLKKYDFQVATTFLVLPFSVLLTLTHLHHPIAGWLINTRPLR